MTDIFDNKHVTAALLFTDLGHYIFLEKKETRGLDMASSKYLRESQVRSAFTGARSDTGWLSHEVIRAGYDAKGPFYVAFFPSQARSIQFVKEEAAHSIIWPALVLIGAGGKHYLFAVMKMTHVDGASQLYHAPFPNTYDDGRICWGENGNQAVDASQAEKTLDLFFESPFNHDLATGKSKKGTSLLNIYTASQGAFYPVEDLVPFRQNLESMLNYLLTETRR